MIMIVGSTHDDILYFSSIITGKREEVVLDHIRVEIGKIFNQEVLLVKDIYTNYLSSAITLYLIQKYYIILCFAVGRCLAYTKDWQVGQIALSQHTYTGDVDQMAEADARLGQIPGFPAYYVTQEDILGYLQNAFEARTFSEVHRAVYFSSNHVYSARDELKALSANDRLFGASERVVLESTFGGIALSCYLFHVPFVAAKVITGFLDQKRTVEEYAKSLSKYADIGKAIVATIGEISRNDVIGG